MPSGVYQHKKGYKIRNTSKMNKAKKGKKRPPFSEEWKRNISKATKGLKKPPFSEEHIKHLKEADNKGRVKKGDIGLTTGKHWKLSKKRRMPPFTELRKQNMSEARKGEKSHFWKGGITTYERKLFLNSNYRARRKNAEGFYTFDEWELLKRQYGYICPACGKKEPEIKLTPDHIIPLSKGGSNYIENIQPLCRSCNCKKYNTLIIKYDSQN